MTETAKVMNQIFKKIDKPDVEKECPKVDFDKMREVAMENLHLLNEQIAREHKRFIEYYASPNDTAESIANEPILKPEWLKDVKGHMLKAVMYAEDSVKTAELSGEGAYPNIEQYLAELNYMILMICDFMTHEHRWNENGICDQCGQDGNA